MSLVNFSVVGRTGVITLNAPKTLNALTFAMGSEFKGLVTSLNYALTVPPGSIDPVVHEGTPPLEPRMNLPEGTPDINCVVLTGSGRAFSAGGDLEFLRTRTAAPPQVNASTMMNFYQNFLSIRSLPVPIVAAINGPAIGAGLCVTLAADYRVSVADAKLAFNFCRLGIHPGMGGSYYLPKIIGHPTASELFLSARTFNGTEGYYNGLINKLLSADNFQEESLELASSFASSSPVASRGLIQTLRAQQDDGLHAALRREADQQALCYSRSDWKEGLEALVGRRDPDFKPYFSH